MATPPDFTAGQVLTAAQMNAVGLWKMTPTSATNGTIGANGDVTFSAVASVNVNGCFTDDFNNYRIMFTDLRIITSNQDLLFRLRASGSDATGANYSWGQINYDNVSTVFSQSGGNAVTSATISRLGAGNFTTVAIDIFQPKVATQTGANMHSGFSNGNYIWRNGGFIHGLSTAYDGFTIFPAANTFTGIISVYGYN